MRTHTAVESNVGQPWQPGGKSLQLQGSALATRWKITADPGVSLCNPMENHCRSRGQPWQPDGKTLQIHGSALATRWKITADPWLRLGNPKANSLYITVRTRGHTHCTCVGRCSHAMANSLYIQGSVLAKLLHTIIAYALTVYESVLATRLQIYCTSMGQSWRPNGKL